MAMGEGAGAGVGPRRFRHRIAVRYGEVDQQGVAFNAHYLAWCDDAMERWFRATGMRPAQAQWDFMLKRAEIEWQGSATTADDVDIDVAVVRWGRTSFEVGFAGAVGGHPVFTARITYVGVGHGTKQTAPPPAEVRHALGEAVDLFGDPGKAPAEAGTAPADGAG